MYNVLYVHHVIYVTWSWQFDLYTYHKQEQVTESDTASKSEKIKPERRNHWMSLPLFAYFLNCVVCGWCRYSRSAQGRRRVWVGHRSIRRVLHGARSTVAAQLHVQVQGDRRRGPATPVAARMSQRVASRRSAPSVSEQFCHFSETMSEN